MKFKKLSILSMFLLITWTGLAQLPVQVTGVLKKKGANDTRMFEVVDGKPVEIARSAADKHGRFGFLFYPSYEGLYLIGSGAEGSAADSYKFYFKAGDHLSLVLLDSTYKLTGKLNSRENVLLSEWYDLIAPIAYQSTNFIKVNSTYIDFFPQLERTVAKASVFLKGRKTGNARFDRQVQGYMDWDLASYAANFLYTPRTLHPEIQDWSAFIKQISTVDFAKHAYLAYGYPWGLRTLGNFLNMDIRRQQVKFGGKLDRVEKTIAFLPNDTLKGDFALNLAKGYKNYADFEALRKVYGKYILTTAQKKREEELITQLATLKPGDAAFNFSYPDQKGKVFSMKDLKGKVVLIDVWATWCAPCKVEIPHLKKLEEELKGHNVQIVSISVDEEKDREKWLKMIDAENLGGLQLFASGWGDLAKFYKIKGIPRFMIFDQEGRIVMVDAPRPSDPKLKTLLQELSVEK
jgi:thiol-disulfide isomerase/thioredoxin